MGNEKQVQHGISGTSWKNGRCNCDECYQAHLRHQKAYKEKRKAKIDSGEIEPTHGTHSSYTMGCRCAECSEANRIYLNRYAASRREAFKAEGKDVPHGTSRGYQWGCRCEACKVARLGSPKEKVLRVTRDHVNDLMELQRNKCAICGSEVEKLHLDHDHADRTIRGMLCVMCNTGLGRFKDSVELLESAIAYLSSPPAVQMFPEDIPLYRAIPKG